ncbi:Gfo/Idh/MocA family protein [Paenibacillus sp. GYB003]|uniref:Gfo/Idh/MocA family protein n=1 Tax=Paenibacillus sp. GYB003 TaxID=2994392 RepID=UPI002F967369
MKPFRIVVAGCGGMAKKWVSYGLSREDCDIVGLADIRLSAAEAMAEQYGIACRAYTDLSEAIADSGANLVFDVTIPQAHRSIVTTAVANGCSVLGEKPMAASMEDAKAIAEAVRRSGQSYAIMQNRRYLRGIRSLKDALDAGAIGAPGFMTANFFLGPHFGGFRETMDSPLLLDMAIHTFDQARFLAGGDPVSVYAHEFNPPGSWYAGKAAAACIFEFDNGIVFTYNGSWCAEGAPTSWESSWRITGSGGTAIWDGERPPYIETVVTPAPAGGGEPGLFRRTERGPALDERWTGREGHDGCLDDMFAALAEGREAETTYSDNIKSVAMVYGAIDSAAAGKKVSLLSYYR